MVVLSIFSDSYGIFPVKTRNQRVNSPKFANIYLIDEPNYEDSILNPDGNRTIQYEKTLAHPDIRQPIKIIDSLRK
jgi:hypothetical protein